MYRTICTELWTDPEIKSLDVPTKLLFLYLITNPHTHLSGIYYLAEETLLKETGLKRIPYRYGIDTLSRLEKAFRDDHTETIFVTNMFSYQGTGEKNERAAARHLTTLHHCSLIHKFLARYPAITHRLDRYPIDTLSDSGKRCPSVPVPVSSSDSVPDSEVKSKSHSGSNGRNYRDEAKQILAFLNEKSHKGFRENATNLDFIVARLRSGVDLQTCKTLVARKVHDWLADPKMMHYLRPETLFNKTKFETYLAEVTR